MTRTPWIFSLLWLLLHVASVRAQPSTTLDELSARILTLEAEVATLRAAQRPAALGVPDGLTLRILGYADLGFFYAFGDGVAYVRDAGKVERPEFAEYPWVFLGDPWGNPINTQGDSADLGLSRTNIPRFDPIASRGKPSFLANLFNLTVQASLGARFFFQASVNVMPRQGRLGSPGDVLDMDLLYLQFRPFERYDLSIYAGKFDSVVGIEYRVRRAPDRFGITPSLLARYTTGTPVGIKIRGSFKKGVFTYALALTNGSNTTEQLGHVYNEIDHNFFKTVSGRLSTAHRLGTTTTAQIELGFSGAFGAQDLQPREDLYQFQVAADLQLRVWDLALRAEYLLIRTTGEGPNNGPWLRAQAVSAELAWQLWSFVGILARVDFRSGQLFADPNLYLSELLRVTAGVRFDITWNLLLKAEYLRLQELSGPELNDDLLTSSLVFRF